MNEIAKRKYKEKNTEKKTIIVLKGNSENPILISFPFLYD